MERLLLGCRWPSSLRLLSILIAVEVDAEVEVRINMRSNFFKMSKVALGFAVALTANGALANNIEIDAGTITGGTFNGISQTATEFTVIDPNNLATASSTYIDINGNGVIDVGDIFIDSQMNGVDVDLATESGGSAVSGTFGTTWSLSSEWMLWGVVVDNGGELAGGIAGGFLNLFYNDIESLLAGNSIGANDGKQVLNIDLTGSSLTGVNLALDGVVDYSWCMPGCDPFVSGFFNWEDPQKIDGAEYTNWFDYWGAGLGQNPVISIDVVADTRFEPNSLVDPVTDDGSKSLNDFFAGVDSTDRGAFDFFLDQIGYGGIDADKQLGLSVRSGEELDLSITQKVPEPSSLAILGLGLLGFAGRKRFTK